MKNNTTIFSFAWSNRLWIVLTFAGIASWGMYEISRMNIDALPDITGVQVAVYTKTGALDPEQIEKTVTTPIENEMSGLPDVTDIRSISKYGLSQVTVVFRDSKSILEARQQVYEQLSVVSGNLPEGLTPEMGPVTTGLGEIFMYSVLAVPGTELSRKSDIERLTYLRTVHDTMIRPALRKVAGVADADSNGGFKQEVHVNIIPAKMQQYGITLNQIISRLDTLGYSFGGGLIEREGNQVIVRTAGIVNSLSTIESIPIQLNAFGKQIRVRDVANVRIDHAQRLGAATMNGEEIVLGTVLMRTGANSRSAALDAEARLKSISLPRDVTVKVLYNRAHLVDATIHTVTKNLVEGAGLVVIILLLLLGNFRAAVLVSLAIPLSMFIAAGFMNRFGISANLMSLGAIDFGLLVDASIVVIENFLQKIEEKEGTFSFQERVSIMGEAVSEVIRPVTIGLVIIMIVYIPVLSLEGIEGKMFHPMAMVVLLALGASLLTAVLFMPVAGVVLLGKHSAAGSSRIFSAITALYSPSLRLALKYPVSLLAGSLFFATVSIFVYFRLGVDFIPRLNEGDLVIGLVRDSQMSLSKSIHWQKESEKIIRTFPEVENVFSRMGTPESATDPMNVNFADTFVVLKKGEWPKVDGKQRSKEELFSAMERKLVDEISVEQDISPTQPIEMRFNEMLEGSRADITLRIIGNDLNILVEKIQAAISILEKIPGASAVEVDEMTALTTSPVLDVTLDQARLIRYGVSLSEAGEALETAMSGKVLGSVYLDGFRYPLRLHMDENLRRDFLEISRIPVSPETGGSVPLSQLVHFSQSNQVTKIAHTYGRRYAAVSIYISGRDIGSFVTEAEQKIREGVDLPTGYETEWGGQFKNLIRARERFSILIPATIIIIFLLVYRTLGSLRDTLFVLSGVPLAVTGGIFSLYLRGMNFSVSAAIGFIVLMGISILNTLVLMNVYKQFRQSNMSPYEIVWKGTMSRLRPVLMTALVASLGFLPMALNTGLGSEVQRPLATVVVGGLITSTLLTLMLLPSLVYRFGFTRKSLSP